MRKAFKKLLASLLALAMVCALAAPVFADTTSQGSFDKHSFNGYQIFTGTYDATSKKLTNVAWGTGVKSDELLMDLVSEFPGIFTAGMTAQQVAKQLDGWGATDDNTIKFTKVVSGRLADTPTCSNVSSTTLNFPTAGYYLVVDASVLSDHDAASMTMLKVQDAGNITITSKVVKPTLTTRVRKRDGMTWDTAADYQTGDTIKIRMTATLPASTDKAYDFYEAYRIAFNSTYSGGIDVAKLSVESATITETNGTAIDLTPGSYTNIHDSAYQTFTFTTGDLKQTGVDLNKGATVEVVYTTTLTSSATTTFGDSNTAVSTANTFSTTLHYFNDPKNSAAAKNPVEDYGTHTPAQNLYLFTYGVKNTKYKDKVDPNNKLAGAGFTLYDSTGTTPIKLNQDSADRYYYPVNDAGAMTEIYSATDGTFNIKGLAPGTYILKETTTPTGYNTCEDITIKIISRPDYYSPFAGLSSCRVDLSGSDKMINEIVDHSGVVLPSTGGIGTTLFYVVGGLLMVGAAVLLVTKKRMQKN